MVVGEVHSDPQRMAEGLQSSLSCGKTDGGEEQQQQAFLLQGRFIVISRGISDEQVIRNGFP